MRYVLPKSLTWWAGLAAILIGLAALALPEHGPLGELAGVIALLIGANDAAPATLITLGLGLIGLRDRLERATPQRREAMKTLSAALQAHLDSGTTTLAWCWRIERADGVVFGFTDHDRPLAFGGVTYEPESGFAASEIRSGTDLAVDAQEAEGVLTSDTITETDILDGRWDNAAVEVWRVNWSAVVAARADAPRRHRPGPPRPARLRRRGALARAPAEPDRRAHLPARLRRRARRRPLRRRPRRSGVQGRPARSTALTGDRSFTASGSAASPPAGSPSAG